MIQESKICIETSDASLNHPSYQLIRRDRTLDVGGILLFVKKSHKLILSYIDSIFETITSQNSAGIKMKLIFESI